QSPDQGRRRKGDRGVRAAHGRQYHARGAGAEEGGSSEAAETVGRAAAASGAVVSSQQSVVSLVRNLHKEELKESVRYGRCATSPALQRWVNDDVKGASCKDAVKSNAKDEDPLGRREALQEDWLGKDQTWPGLPASYPYFEGDQA